jgi:hypothetical protein
LLFRLCPKGTPLEEESIKVEFFKIDPSLRSG